MGFRQNSVAVLLAFSGLGSILGVNGSWLFGAMQEREEDYRRAMQPRQLVQCSSGSKACGVLGCVASRRCCNAGAGWGCLAGNACYTAGGYVDCYSTTMVMPTYSRKCYDFTQTGCSALQACFKCLSTAPSCATEVIAGGGDTWLECATKATVVTVTAAAETSSGSDTTSIDDSTITPATGRTGTSTPIRTSTSTGLPSPTNTESEGLSGGAIAGIVIGAVAGIAIIAGLIFFLCVKKGGNDANGAVAQQQQQYQQPQQPPMSYPQPPYSPPPQQQQYAPQPPYSPLPGYQGQMAHNGYAPDGQPMVPPVSSPVYPEPSKQQPVMPAELH